MSKSVLPRIDSGGYAQEQGPGRAETGTVPLTVNKKTEARFNSGTEKGSTLMMELKNGVQDGCAETCGKPVTNADYVTWETCNSVCT